MSLLSLKVYQYTVIAGKISEIGGDHTLEIEDLDGDGLISQREIAEHFGTTAQGGVQGTNGLDDHDAEFIISRSGNLKHPFTLYTTNPNMQVSDDFETGRMKQNFRPYNPTLDGINCFAADTLIETASGQVEIGKLVIGDMVRTRDSGYQPVRWVGRRHLSDAELAKAPNLRPIRIRAGALGTGIPECDLVVSPQHRILVRSAMATKMFGTEEILIAAKQLLQVVGIEVALDLSSITYVHVLFDDHQIIYSNHAETESLYIGPEALKSVGSAARAEIYAIFPELRDNLARCESVRAFAPGRMGRQLAARHAKNLKPLVR